MEYEKQLSILKQLIRIIKKDTGAVIFLLVIVAVIATGSLAFRYFTILIERIDEKVEAVEERVIPSTANIVEDKAILDDKISKILAELRTVTNSDRAKLFQYHNSVLSVDSIHFLYVSVTHESVKPGVSAEILNLQQLPSSLFNKSVEHFTKSEEVSCIELDSIDNEVVSQLLRNQNVSMSCNYPIRSNRGDIVGFITLNYSGSFQVNEDALQTSMPFAAIRIFDALHT